MHQEVFCLLAPTMKVLEINTKIVHLVVLGLTMNYYGTKYLY